MRRIAERDTSQGERDADLRHDDPAAPSAEQTAEDRRVILIEKWRPDEFEFIGERQFAHQAENAERHFGFRQPRRLRDVDEQKWDARAEPEPEHGTDARVDGEIAQRSPHSRFGGQSLLLHGHSGLISTARLSLSF